MELALSLLPVITFISRALNAQNLLVKESTVQSQVSSHKKIANNAHNPPTQDAQVPHWPQPLDLDRIMFGLLTAMICTLFGSPKLKLFHSPLTQNTSLALQELQIQTTVTLAPTELLPLHQLSQLMQELSH